MSHRKHQLMDWADSLPRSWNARRLKTFADVQASNVDKNVNEGEIPVQLCNYTDVYYGDMILARTDFMKATATPLELTKFQLRGGDVLITKDSESGTDIAVPAYVPETLDGVICGYHLAIVRPKQSQIDGQYLYFAFLTHGVRDQFHVAANGITRYGLSQHDIIANCAIKANARSVDFSPHEGGSVD
jgi:type I restriction enzyme S subunit